jgi:hypothetical protein
LDFGTQSAYDGTVSLTPFAEPSSMTDTPSNEPSAPEVASADAPAAGPAMPDRLSVNPRSPFYNPEVLKHDVGIRFKGTERFDVEEYCISESWVRVAAGKSKDRFGMPLTIKLSGPVEAWVKR